MDELAGGCRTKKQRPHLAGEASIFPLNQEKHCRKTASELAGRRVNETLIGSGPARISIECYLKFL
jgi:hypothetical protein